VHPCAAQMFRLVILHSRGVHVGKNCDACFVSACEKGKKTLPGTFQLSGSSCISFVRRSTSRSILSRSWCMVNCSWRRSWSISRSDSAFRRRRSLSLAASNSWLYFIFSSLSACFIDRIDSSTFNLSAWIISAALSSAAACAAAAPSALAASCGVRNRKEEKS
jgi:hypothetical protein